MRLIQHIQTYNSVGRLYIFTVALYYGTSWGIVFQKLIWTIRIENLKLLNAEDHTT